MGGREVYPEKKLRCMRKTPKFKVWNIQISWVAFLFIQITDNQWKGTLNLITHNAFLSNLKMLQNAYTLFEKKSLEISHLKCEKGQPHLSLFLAPSLNNFI